MTTEALIAVGLEDTLQFACHPGISCFNHCCRDLNQALAPYDVLRLRRHLELTSQEFLRQYTCEHTGPATGMPVVSLRFDDDRQRACPFVTPAGCRVYAARPASCRLYPLARAVRRSRADGRISVHYAVLQEAHCRGFNETRTQTVRDWIDNQELEIDFEMTDLLMELISLKNRLRPGPLPAEQRQWLHMAFYDLDLFRKKIDSGEVEIGEFESIPDQNDDRRWLRWSMAWIRRRLFGRI